MPYITRKERESEHHQRNPELYEKTPILDADSLALLNLKGIEDDQIDVLKFLKQVNQNKEKRPN